MYTIKGEPRERIYPKARRMRRISTYPRHTSSRGTISTRTSKVRKRANMVSPPHFCCCSSAAPKHSYGFGSFGAGGSSWLSDGSVEGITWPLNRYELVQVSAASCQQQLHA